MSSPKKPSHPTHDDDLWAIPAQREAPTRPRPKDSARSLPTRQTKEPTATRSRRRSYVEPWDLPMDHPDWEPETISPDGSEWDDLETHFDPNEPWPNEDPYDDRPEWVKKGYGSERSWWENETYMTHPEPPPDPDDY